MKKQLLVISRSRRRVPNLSALDRCLFGFCSLFLDLRRIQRSAVIIQPSTLLKFHSLLKQPNTSFRKILVNARNRRQIANQCGCGDLPVECVFCMRHTQTATALGDVLFAAGLKSTRTSLSAFEGLLDSLMTLASIIHTIVLARILYPFEVFIPAEVRHARESFRKTLALGAQQQFLEQGTMRDLDATTVSRSTPLQHIDDAWIQVSDDKVCHRPPPNVSINDCIFQPHVCQSRANHPD
jgi:hypothetical protein